MAERDGDNRVLRAKYDDYCSHQIAEVVLKLSPDEVYSLAEAEARAANRVAPASFDEAVRLATGKVRERLDLPDFQAWAEEYEKDPGKFDPHLMGLWKERGSRGSTCTDT